MLKDFSFVCLSFQMFLSALKTCPFARCMLAQKNIKNKQFFFRSLLFVGILIRSVAYCNISICLFWSVKTAFCFCFLPSFCADKSKSIQIIIYYQSIIDLCLVSGKQFSTFLEKKNGENGKLNLRVRCAMISQLMPSVNNNFLLISIVNIHHAFPPTTHFVTKTLKKVLFWNVIIGFNALVAIIFFNFPIVSTPNQNYVNRTTNSALITFKVEIQKKFFKKKKVILCNQTYFCSRWRTTTTRLYNKSEWADNFQKKKSFEKEEWI